MKALAYWAVASILAFGALSFGYHSYLNSHPREFLVVVDSSFPMSGAWSSVPDVLDRIDDRRYARFKLWTEKAEVHDWAASLRRGRSTPFAPRDFERLLARSAESGVANAARRILVTNASDAELEGFGDWEIVRVER